MRKNCAEVVRAWEFGRANRRADSIWTDGRQIMSYGTVILEPVDGLGLVLNRTRYSHTTSTHQNALAAYFGDRIRHIMDDVPRGTRSIAVWHSNRAA